MALKKGRHRSVDFETNRLSVAILPTKLRISLTVHDGGRSGIVLILSRLASIPLCEIMNLRNFPNVTLKIYLDGLSLIPCILKVEKESSRSVMCCDMLLLLTIMSSMYAFMFLMI